MTVRPAVSEDEATVVRVLVRAFASDPVARYLLRERDYAGALETMFTAFARHVFFPHGEVWLEPSGGGAALWAPPGAWDVRATSLLRMAPALLRASGARAARSARAMMRLRDEHPRAPHEYLFAIGVDPAQQGRGIGSELLAAVLRTCDATSRSAYLEASTETSARLYARHGFRVTRELRVLEDAPPVWLMWREPWPVKLDP